MSQTERTLAELEALLADNVLKDIGAQDLRDAVLATALGGYAGLIHRLSSGVGIIVGVDATPVVVDVYDLITARSAAVHTDGAEASLVSSALIPGVDGTYAFSFGAAFTASQNNRKIIFQTFVNAVATDLETERFFSTGSNIAAVSLGGLFPLAAADVIDVRVSSSTGAPDLSFVSASLSMFRVG